MMLLKWQSLSSSNQSVQSRNLGSCFFYGIIVLEDINFDIDTNFEGIWYCINETIMNIISTPQSARLTAPLAGKLK